ncbi:MAG: 30S ribosomal protein S6, partial [Bdellovibrio sp.]
ESVVILHPDASLEEQKTLFRKNQGIVQEAGGEVFAVDTWGKRTLANPILKNRKGIYFHSLFMAAPSVIAELERTMRINDKVLRYLHVRLEERMPLSKHQEKFKRQLAESAQREKEREAKIQARKAAAAAEREREREE